MNVTNGHPSSLLFQSDSQHSRPRMDAKRLAHGVDRNPYSRPAPPPAAPCVSWQRGAGLRGLIRASCLHFRGQREVPGAALRRTAPLGGTQAGPPGGSVLFRVTTPSGGTGGTQTAIVSRGTPPGHRGSSGGSSGAGEAAASHAATHAQAQGGRPGTSSGRDGAAAGVTQGRARAGGRRRRRGRPPLASRAPRAPRRRGGVQHGNWN